MTGPLKVFLVFFYLATAVSFSSELQKDQIHQDYNDGNFEKVVQDIKAFQKENKSYKREDSIFIAKHLSVVYTANPESRELGKYYMHQLLQLMPKAELVDMFVSDEIDRIFQKVRKEFVVRQGSFGVSEEEVHSPKSAPATQTSKDTEIWKDKKTWILIGSGTVAAAALGWVLFSEDEPKAKEIRYVVPATE